MTSTSKPEKRIEITVSPEGAVSIKTSGFQGGSCKDATRDLEKALGVAGSEQLTQEYFESEPANEQLRQGS